VRRLFGIFLDVALLALPLYGGGNSHADAPILTVDAAGVKQLVSTSRGRVMVLNFWATWCAPCREEFPDLLKLRKTMAPRGLDLYFISIDDPRDTVSTLRAFLRRQGVDFPTYIKKKGNDEGFINAIDPEWSGALPATFIYARSGGLVRRLVDSQTFEGLSRLVEPLLKGDQKEQ
jgi:thiol-disulfide isomerase/thioredoxin